MQHFSTGIWRHHLPSLRIVEALNSVKLHNCYCMLTAFCCLHAPKPRSYFGAPLSRRRLYILLVRRDVLRPGIDAENLQNHIHDLMKSMKIDPSDSYSWHFGQTPAHMELELAFALAK